MAIHLGIRLVRTLGKVTWPTTWAKPLEVRSRPHSQPIEEAVRSRIILEHSMPESNCSPGVPLRATPGQLRGCQQYFAIRFSLASSRSTSDRLGNGEIRSSRSALRFANSSLATGRLPTCRFCRRLAYIRRAAAPARCANFPLRLVHRCSSSLKYLYHVYLLYFNCFMEKIGGNFQYPYMEPKFPVIVRCRYVR